jgi:hypothetical protein
MRRPILLFTVVFAVAGSAQTTRDGLRAQAKQLLDSETAREKVGDCPAAKTTYDSNVCLAKAATAADRSLKTFETAVHDLLNLASPQSAAEFSRVEDLWHTYLAAAAMAAFHQFDGGTGGPSSQLETRIRLVRSHLRELDAIYYSTLHL